MRQTKPVSVCSSQGSNEFSIPRDPFEPSNLRSPIQVVPVLENERSEGDEECGKYDLESESDISWEVLLRLNVDEICGGVLVSKNWILTNAECGKSIISYGGSVRNQGITDCHKRISNCCGLKRTVRGSLLIDLARVKKSAFQKSKFIPNTRMGCGQTSWRW